MLLKLKESIITGGEHYSPTTITPPHPAGVIDTDALKIRDAEAEVLVRRGTAVHYTPEQAEPEVPAGGPVVTHVQTIVDADDTGSGVNADQVEDRLAGLDDMKKDELVAMAKDMGLEAAGKTKAELIDSIKSAAQKD